MQVMPFSADEYAARVRTVRGAMRAHDVDAMLISSPEDVYYLAGLSHQGYFALTLLVLPVEGTPLLVMRSMERTTLAAQAPDIEHVGFGDDAEPADAVRSAIEKLGLTGGRLGIAKASMTFPLAVWEAASARLPRATWVDTTGVVDEVRSVKSPAEIACIRQAAAISDRAVMAGISVAGVGINEREVAAAVYRSMILGGSEYPGFAPLIRSTQTLWHEHSTWRDQVLAPGDTLLMELSASVHRYHAPLTRLVHVGRIDPAVAAASEIALAGQDAARRALRPGATASQVYAAWQAVIDDALGHNRYRRHHCGYLVGIGFPPSWVGGSSVTGLRADSDLPIREGMAFHLLSWILGQEVADYGVSDTVLVGPDEEAELLTSTGRSPRLLA